MVTQRDLARHLGLSQQAVSFALNGRPGVSDETRDQVLSAAAELGYRVNAAARDLRGGRSRHVGVLMQSNPTVRGLHPVAWEIVGGINHQLAEGGLYTTLIRFTDAIEGPEDLHRAFAEQVFGAMIVVGLDRVFHQRFAELFPEAIWVDHQDRPPRRAVWRDEEAAGRLAAERLIAAGHRELRYLRTGWKPGAWVDERLRGARQAADGASVSLVEQVMQARKGDPNDKLPAGVEPGCALLVAEAYLALRLQPLLAQAGLVPGRDCSLCCADDAELLADAWPELDRVDFDRFALGGAAARLAMGQTADPDSAATSIVIPSHPVDGSTCLTVAR